MTRGEGYELIDFGSGRKLERFGQVMLDRPSPAADQQVPVCPAMWDEATARFERRSADTGRWRAAKGLPEQWPLEMADLRFVLKPTPFGHVGIFPEQETNWQWMRRVAARRTSELRVLNLFAYTGGSTLAAAQGGAAVVHVDAARNVVQWARENAKASRLSEASIRWIVDDARRFVTREIRRGAQYDAVILDPPSYGHGPKGQTWKLASDLMPLLADCRRLLSDRPAFVLLTCHSPGYGPAELGACLQETLFGRCSHQVDARPLTISTADGRRLHAGAVARWPG